MKPLKIAVADDESSMREFLMVALARLGHHVVCLAATGQELIDGCLASVPDLVITDIKMPDMDGIEAAARLYRGRPTPVILVSAHHDPELIARAGADHIMAYLVKPIRLEDLEPTIEIAMRRFAQFQALTKEASDLKQALEDRKVIERAKGILMKQAKFDEEQAFRRMQNLASDKNLKLVEIARAILTAREVFGTDGKD